MQVPGPLFPGGILSVPAPQVGGVGDAKGGSTYPALRTDAFTDVTFNISGTGQITDPFFCGTWTTAAVCSKDSKHYVRHLKHSCDNPSCPICMERWASKQAARISERLRGYVEAANGGQTVIVSEFDQPTIEDSSASLANKKRPVLEWQSAILWHRDNSRYLNHYILSAPAGVITPDMDIDKIKQHGRTMAVRVGITGGCMVFHPYRIKESVKNRLSYHCRDAPRMSEDDREKKFWELIKADVLSLGSWMAYVRWGPHFHVIGFGRLPSQKTDGEKAAARVILAGWTVKWIRHVKTETTFNGHEIEDPIAELAVYILSHAAYISGKKAPAWLGVMRPARLKKMGEPDKMSHEVVCPKCGSPVILGGFDASQKFIPQLDQDGAVVDYRLRYHWQKYEIKAAMTRKKSLRRAYGEISWSVCHYMHDNNEFI